MSSSSNPEMEATIQFMDGEFSLIHIPLGLFPLVIKPLLQVLMPREVQPQDDDSDHAGNVSLVSSTENDIFLNISITPLECSVVCKTDLAERFFRPHLALLPETLTAEKITISNDSYNICHIIARTMEAGKRIVEVTAPLATAGISIFYITTYYNDCVLFPKKDREDVVSALLNTGFRFEEPSFKGGPAPRDNRARSTSMSNAGRTKASAFNTIELQRTTFETLQHHTVIPYVDRAAEDSVPPLLVVIMSGHSVRYHTGSGDGDTQGAYGYLTTPDITHDNGDWLKHIDKRFLLSVINVLTLATTPRFLSLTITQENAPSLIVDQELLHYFGNSIQGNDEAALVPIFLDLGRLPIESTGIVCGVGGIIAGEAEKKGWDATSMTFLSTAKSGCVLIGEDVAGAALLAILNFDQNDKKNNQGDDRDSDSSSLGMKDLSSPLREIRTSITGVGPIDIPAPKHKRP